MKLGKLFIPNTPNKILLEETAKWINTNCMVFEKIMTKEGVVIICKSDLFREMTNEEELIPVYSIHSVASTISASGEFFKFVEAGKSEDGKPH